VLHTNTRQVPRLIARTTFGAISAWVTPSTRYALIALLRWWAWPIMGTATGSRSSAAPQRWSGGDPLPRRSEDGGPSLGDGCINDGWLHDGSVDH